MQAPHFAERGLDISGFYHATLNLSIAPKRFLIKQADYRFEQVQWVDGFAAETFSFVHCVVLFEGRQQPGMVYYPHPETKTRDFQNDSLIEVLTQRLDNARYGDKFTLLLPTDKVDIIAPH